MGVRCSFEKSSCLTLLVRNLSLLAFAGVTLAVAALLVAGNKTGVVKVLTDAEKEGAGIMKKASHYLATAGEWIGKYTYEPIVSLFAKKA